MKSGRADLVLLAREFEAIALALSTPVWTQAGVNISLAAGAFSPT
jgi:hypothetical protein